MNFRYHNQIYDIDQYIDLVEKIHPVARFHPVWRFLYEVYYGPAEGNRFLRYLKSADQKVLQTYPPMVEVLIQKVLNGEVKPRAIPLSNKQRDIDTSQINTAFFHEFWEINKNTKSWIEALTWAFMLGVGYKEVFWNGFDNISEGIDKHDDQFNIGDVERLNQNIKNSGLGEDSSLVKNISFVLSAMRNMNSSKKHAGPPTSSFKGRGGLSMDSMLHGELKSITLSPFTVFEDCSATNHDDVRHVTTLKVIPVDVARGFFNTNKIEPDASGTFSPYLLTELKGNADHGLHEESVIVRTFSQKSLPWDEKGKRIVRVNGKTIESGDNPYGAHTGVVAFSVGKAVGRLIGDGVIGPMLGLTDLYESVVSSLFHNIIEYGDPIVAVSAGSMIRPEDVGGRKGPKFIEVPTGATAPSQVQIQASPSHAIHLVQIAQDLISRASGTTSLDFGIVPQRAAQMSAVGMRQLNAANATRHQSIISEVRDAIIEESILLVDIAKKFIILPKQFNVPPDLMPTAQRYFTGKDMDGSVRYLIDLGGGFGFTPNDIIDTINNMKTNGFQFPDSWEFTQKILSSLAPQVANVIGETQMFANIKAKNHLEIFTKARSPQELNMVLDMSPHESHEVFISVFSEFINNRSYDEYPQWKRQFMNLYISLRKKMLVQAVAEKAQLQMQIQQAVAMQQQQMQDNRGQLAGGSPMGQQQGGPPANVMSKNQIGHLQTQSPGRPPINPGQ